jgi:hypothetical protein
MKIYPVQDEENNLHAFEIANWKVSRARATKIVKAISGASIIRKPKRFFSGIREEVFCEFKINGTLFEINEPYGDNSRYWVGKKEEGGWCEELEVVKNAFQAAW